MAVIYDERSPISNRPWYSTILERHYDSQEAAQHYESRELQSRTRLTPEQEEAANLKPEVIRALYDNEVISQARREANIACYFATEEFSVLHPEYVDSEANSAHMGHYFTSRGIESPNLDQLEEAFTSLRDAGLLQLYRNELLKQEKQRTRERVEKIVKRRGGEPSEEQMYAMPLNELAARARSNGIG